MGAASSIMAAAAVAGAGASIYGATQKSGGGDVTRGGASGIPQLFQSPSYGLSHNAEAGLFERQGGFAKSGPERLGLSLVSLGNAAQQTGEVRGMLGPVRSGLVGLNSDLATLRGEVRPGFGRLTDARVTAIRDAASESIGNLRDSLARRNVLGSSFANDAVSRTRLAFAKEEERARAEAAIQEIGLSQQLIQEQAANYGQQLGLLQEDRANLSQQAVIYQSQAQIIANQMDRELQEFAISANALNGVQAALTQQGIAQAQLDALSNAQTSFNRGALAQQLPGLVGQGAGGLEQLLGLFGGGGAGPAGMFAGGTGTNAMTGLAFGGV
jgi:hypothetical protein